MLRIRRAAAEVSEDAAHSCAYEGAAEVSWCGAHTGSRGRGSGYAVDEGMGVLRIRRAAAEAAIMKRIRGSVEVSGYAAYSASAH
ncbi:hypothetical protein [Paenibacillus durus]|uniref:Uncharacterized protein n=1 Tax=Paenibacillus durus TaxID=44251 RepID=A0A089IPL0_PAEDU|nr:hypothetical protein [Paenibacillus durus]AIQ10989.1 hypothetical protein PDUR_02405 [Paenibacillus durus]